MKTTTATNLPAPTEPPAPGRQHRRPEQLLQCVITTLTEWARGERADANEAHDRHDRDTAQQHRNRAENFDHQARQLLPALAALQAPIFLRAYVSGGILQGIASDQPERLDVFIWDDDRQDGNEASVFPDQVYEIPTPETQRTRQEAALQAWTLENDPDSNGIDHKGSEARMKGK